MSRYAEKTEVSSDRTRSEIEATLRRQVAAWRPNMALTCYGDRVAEFTHAEAFASANDHIRTCPRGPMPWATDVAWHKTTDPRLGGSYVSAAGGQWLDHHLQPLYEPGRGWWYWEATLRRDGEIIACWTSEVPGRTGPAGMRWWHWLLMARKWRIRLRRRTG